MGQGCVKAKVSQPKNNCPTSNLEAKSSFKDTDTNSLADKEIRPKTDTITNKNSVNITITLADEPNQACLRAGARPDAAITTKPGDLGLLFLDSPTNVYKSY